MFKVQINGVACAPGGNDATKMMIVLAAIYPLDINEALRRRLGMKWPSGVNNCVI